LPTIGEAHGGAVIVRLELPDEMRGVSETKFERNFLYWHPGEHVFRGLPEPFDVEPFLRRPSEMIEEEPFELSRRNPASPGQFTL
jgi:hypothetical protein